LSLCKFQILSSNVIQFFYICCVDCRNNITLLLRFFFLSFYFCTHIPWDSSFHIFPPIIHINLNTGTGSSVLHLDSPPWLFLNSTACHSCLEVNILLLLQLGRTWIRYIWTLLSIYILVMPTVRFWPKNRTEMSKTEPTFHKTDRFSVLTFFYNFFTIFILFIFLKTFLKLF